MNPQACIAVCLLFCLVACGSQDEAEGVTLGGPPKTGIWHHTKFAVLTTESTCHPNVVLPGANSDFRLSKESGAFQVSDLDESHPAACAYDNALEVLSCAGRETTLVDYRPEGYQAIIRLAHTGEGIVLTSERWSGYLVGEADCTGPHCDLLAAAWRNTFPCAYRVDFIAVWRGDD